MADLKLTIDVTDVQKALTATQRYERQINQLAQRYARGEVSSQAYNRGLLQIKRSYEQLGISSQKATSQVRRYAQQQLEAARQIQTATVAQNNFAAATQNSTRRMGRGQVITQQAGYQIGDFIVQVQSGTNAFVAFGQQATQVAGTLTLLGGKMVLIGTVLGVAIPLATALAAAFMRTRDGASDAGDGIETLTDRLRAARVEMAETAFQLEALRSGFRDFREFALVQGVEEASERVAELRQQIYELEQIGAPTGPNQRNLELALETLETRQEELDTYRETRGAVEAIGDLQERNAALARSALEIYETMVDTARRIGDEFKEGQVQAAEDLANKVAEAAEEMREAAREAAELKSEMNEAKREAELLAAIDIKSGIDSAASSAATLARNLGVSVEAASALMAMGGGRLGDPTARGISGFEESDPRSGSGRTSFDYFQENFGTSWSPTDSSGSGRSGGGGGGGRSLQEIIEERQRLIDQEIELARLSDETRRVREIAIEIENAYGQGIDETQRAAIQSAAEQIAASERVIDQLERQRQMQEQIAETIGNSFGEAFTSIIDGTKSAEEAFRDMMNSIIQELFRLLVMQPLINSITGALGGGGGFLGNLSGKLAEGGTMYPNRPYLVGEHGPEIVMPGRQSSVKNTNLSRDMMGGGQTVDVRVFVDDNGNFDAKVERISQNTIAEAAPSIVKASEQTILNNRKRGGNYRAVFG